MQLPHVQTLAGSRNCTESSNSSRSATQSGMQRHSAVLLGKSLAMAAILQIFSQTGPEKVFGVTAQARCMALFSLKGTLAVRFQRPHQANEMRSQTDEAAKAGLDLCLSPQSLRDGNVAIGNDFRKFFRSKRADRTAIMWHKFRVRSLPGRAGS